MAGMSGATILVIGTLTSAHEILRERLAGSGHRFVAAPYDTSALLLIPEYRPDLLLLDVDLPMQELMEVLSILRLVNASCPVLLLAPGRSGPLLMESIRLDASDPPGEPLAASDLHASVDRALAQARRACAQDDLDNTLLSAEAVRVTVVTLSHYLNNYLTALNGALQLMDEKLNQGHADPELLQLLAGSRASSTNMEAVMRVLRRATNIKLTSYTHTTPMLDIQSALQDELDRLRQLRRI